MSQQPPILIVNENDEPIGSMDINAAYKKQQIHRIVHVMFEDENGEILVQRRGPNVVVYPNCWDTSVGGHVDADEDYYEAALRETAEELGLKNCVLTEIGSFFRREKLNGVMQQRFIHVYKTVIEHATPITIQQSDISDTKWMSVAALKQLIHEYPEQCASGLIDVIGKYYDS